MLRNPTFCSFTSFLIVSLTPFINKPDSSRESTLTTKGKPDFSNIPKSLPKNPPDCHILYN